MLAGLLSNEWEPAFDLPSLSTAFALPARLQSRCLVVFLAGPHPAAAFRCAGRVVVAYDERRAAIFSLGFVAGRLAELRVGLERACLSAGLVLSLGWIWPFWLSDTFPFYWGGTARVAYDHVWKTFLSLLLRSDHVYHAKLRRSVYLLCDFFEATPKASHSSVTCAVRYRVAAEVTCHNLN